MRGKQEKTRRLTWDSPPPHPRTPRKLEETWNPRLEAWEIGKVNLGVFLPFALIKGLYEFLTHFGFVVVLWLYIWRWNSKSPWGRRWVDVLCLESKVSGSCITPFWNLNMEYGLDSKWLEVWVCHLGWVLGCCGLMDYVLDDWCWECVLVLYVSLLLRWMMTETLCVWECVVSCPMVVMFELERD